MVQYSRDIFQWRMLYSATNLRIRNSAKCISKSSLKNKTCKHVKWVILTYDMALLWVWNFLTS